jgi:O-methyltransferase
MMNELTAGQAHAYLTLLAKTLARYPLQACDRLLLGVLRDMRHPSCDEIRRWFFVNAWGLSHERVVPALRALGMDWPAEAETMIGLARLRNLSVCAEDVLRAGVVGDFMEAGVWRGGACIYLRAILEAFGNHDRKVWVADSFQGVPPPDHMRYGADLGDTLYAYPELAVSLSTVQANFRRYGFLDDRVGFLPGWFRDTLPDAAVGPLALLRLDGDLYESTIITLRSLYGKVSPGGYVIVDDYGGIPACRQAVDDFRGELDIRDPLRRIDWAGVFWQVTGGGAATSSIPHDTTRPGENGRVVMPRVAWFELGMDDPKRAVTFYSEVFGWKCDKLPGLAECWVMATDGDGHAGIDGRLVRRRYPGETTTCWIEVPSVDDFLTRIVEHGGTALTRNVPIPGMGECACCQDTEGNVFGIVRFDAPPVQAHAPRAAPSLLAASTGMTSGDPHTEICDGC